MRSRAKARPSIYVLAGTNGAGKSSVAGAEVRRRGADYFNPDEVARRILAAYPELSPDEANSQAWLQGKRLLQKAIAGRLEFAFETTLGGNTIPALLADAHDAGLAVRVWYIGLEGPELHLARVRARVADGGHDIPEARIRERYDRSRENLVRLLPKLTELRVFDNTEEGNPALGVAPRPRLILHMADRVIREACEATAVPQWAKPLFLAALRQYPT
ncbi:MAG TPA: zeta toxin family protein [Longimicrobiaceae bacterium]|nr:zeta toxin family protein [Longimicrobiaceae bacterium]